MEEKLSVKGNEINGIEKLKNRKIEELQVMKQ